jgi:signal transduction protein with GAF and PtsI domain
MNEAELKRLIRDAETRLERLEGVEDAERREAAYRQVLLEMLQVLEETRRHFKSERLKGLRERIQRLLTETPDEAVGLPEPPQPPKQERH